MRPSALPALSNAAPYHLVTDSSVEDLNANIPSLKEEIDALNFRFCLLSRTFPDSHLPRPNLVIITDDRSPYQEDRWELVRMGDVVLEFSLPDNRCITGDPDLDIPQLVTTFTFTVNYNQDTAKK